MTTLAQESAENVADFVENYNPDSSPDESMIDILTNLMHYCDLKDIDFDDALSMATDHFSEECDD